MGTLTREDVEGDLKDALNTHNRIKDDLKSTTDKAAANVAGQLSSKRNAEKVERDLKQHLKNGDVLAEIEKIDKTLGRLQSVSKSIVGTLAKPYDFAALEERIHACLARIGDVDAAPRVRAAVEAEAEDEDGWIEIVPARPADQPREPRQHESGALPFRLR